MNIFYLDHCPHQAAIALGDKHVVKMILESAQMLCTAQRLTGNNSPKLYKAAYINHPSTIWARFSRQHYYWLYDHFLELQDEYQFRYGREHKCALLNVELSGFQHTHNEWFEPPQCMPDQYKSSDTVAAYRAYYNGAKRAMHVWTNRDKPEWIL